MSITEALLGLVQEFPQAFTNPEAPAHPAAPAPLPHVQSAATVKTQHLLQLIDQFPQAFADPEALRESQAAATMAIVTAVPDPAPATTVAPDPVRLPPGYALALQRQIPTQTWGQVDCYLTYGDRGLQELWITVGKSGTEVQSLSEAIARLVNLLLAHQVPLPEIMRQLRGIRGADAEGLGPHRILGLADLIGKVLQEAPATIESAIGLQQLTTRAVESAVSTPVQQSTTTSANSSVKSPHDSGLVAETAPVWVNMAEDDQSAALCPACGAELLQINGCSGGTCNVCGYSSCS